MSDGPRMKFPKEEEYGRGCVSLDDRKGGSSNIGIDTWGGTAERMAKYEEKLRSNKPDRSLLKKTPAGICFLTTACTQAAGLPDDCHELTTLRRFRDTFVRGLSNGESLIHEYYAVSPLIVPKLSDEELAAIYDKVRRIVSQIEREEFQAAFNAYAEMFTELRQKHLETV